MFLDGKKTYVLAALAIVYAVAAVALGKLSGNEAVEVIFAALGGAALRHGISK